MLTMTSMNAFEFKIVNIVIDIFANCYKRVSSVKQKYL